MSEFDRKNDKRIVQVGDILTDADGVEWLVAAHNDLYTTIERVTGGWKEPDLTVEQLATWMGWSDE